MTRTVVTRAIDAPLGLVFETIADINNYSRAVRHIVRAEIISEVKAGVGTRFRETRLMKGREATTELEITEYGKDDRVRMVADSHGTVWDTLFTVEDTAGRTLLTMTMDARAQKFWPRLINPLIKGVIRKFIEQDMDAVRIYCENKTI